MDTPNPSLRVNPGGSLRPAQVVGRDEFIAAVWSRLEQQSVLLTSERRMGKTSVMRKMTREAKRGTCPIKRSLQGINTPEEFAKALVADVEANAPGVLNRPFVKRLRKAGVKKIGARSVEVEFEPASDDAWKDVVVETFAELESGVDERIVLFWDELPHMVDAVARKCDAGTARDLLDVLRAMRETYPGVRMVLSGSLGIHHVVDRLRLEGGMWVPTHDMVLLDLPPLRARDAGYLAAELLHNERIACVDAGGVARVIAAEVGNVPYYVHHTVARLQTDQLQDGEPVTAERAKATIDQVLLDPNDEWQLKHYVDRVPVYYPQQVDLAYALLDAVATGPAPRTQAEIQNLVAARMEPPPDAQLRALLELLCKDHYLKAGYSFRLELVRRAWCARRSIS